MMPEQLKQLNVLLNTLSNTKGVLPKDKQYIEAVKQICKNLQNQKNT